MSAGLHVCLVSGRCQMRMQKASLFAAEGLSLMLPRHPSQGPLSSGCAVVPIAPRCLPTSNTDQGEARGKGR